MKPMRLYAILSDIHSNYQALLEVKKDAKKVAQEEGYDHVHFVCLGDVVDYGPQPNRCIAWVREHAGVVIQGNHEKAVAAPFREPPYATVAEDYWPITLWTRRVLDDEHRKAIHGWKTRCDLPLASETFTLFHGSLTSVNSYVNCARSAGENLTQLRTHYGLFGHTHFQGYFVEGFEDAITFLACPAGTESPRPDKWHMAPVGVWKPLPGQWQRAIFNPGSVGQPRRHALLMDAGVLPDYRAAYMLLRLNGHGKGEFRFQRVDYKINETIRLLREEVYWPVKTDDGVNGSSIYKDASSPPHEQDPMRQKLDETLAQMSELLSNLVEGALIPALKYG